MSPTSTATVPTFSEHPNRRRVIVTDPVQDERFQFGTPAAVTPEPHSTDEVPWCFPVDSAARLATNSITLPYRVRVYVRTPDATLVETISDRGEWTIDRREFYTLELSSLPFKILIAGDGRLVVVQDDDGTEIRFPDSDELHLGARSSHLRPARTLTTTEDPEDLFTVVSEFGAALKTTSCERSWPTLRGHPPLVELGEELDIPGGSQRPDTGVTIELPPTLYHLFPAASLAYYLGAVLEPGDTPMLHTDTGFTFDLTSRGGYERTVSDVLQHVFTLDCFTRSEGFYPDPVEGRQQSDLPLDYATLYDRPLAEQLEAYLSVPFDAVEPYRPPWPLTADVPLDPASVELFPHLVSELAFIRGDSSITLSSGAAQGSDGPSGVFTRLPPAQTTHQTYFGQGFAIGANKGVRAAYERRFQNQPADPDRIGVAIVCNDETMVSEVQESTYGNRKGVDFDVQTHIGLTVAELREVFESDVDLVHYIGHVYRDGIGCTDGMLDAESLESVAPTAFILNGCRSVWQGTQLVEQGAAGGIVTLEDVPDPSAATLGTHISRLLNEGWQLDTAVEVIKRASLAGENYAVVGRPSTSIVDTDGFANLVTITARDDGEFDVVVSSFVDDSFSGIGSLVFVYELQDADTNYLNGQDIGPITVSADRLERFLSLATIPVRVQNAGDATWHSLQWSDEIDVHALHD